MFAIPFIPDVRHLHACSFSLTSLFCSCLVQEGVFGGGGLQGEQEELLSRFVDEDNHTVLAGIRACKLAGSSETAMALLKACEARWAQGPLARDRHRERGGEGESGAAGGAECEWREMNIRTRLSRR